MRGAEEREAARVEPFAVQWQVWEGKCSEGLMLELYDDCVLQCAVHTH